MAQFKATIKSFDDAEAFLGGRTEKKLAHNTIVRVAKWSAPAAYGLDRTPEEIEVVYHRTVIATFHDDGRKEYRNGGFETATTKQRINELLPAGFGVYQQDHEWFMCRVDVDPPHATTASAWPKTLYLDKMNEIIVMGRPLDGLSMSNMPTARI